MNGFQKDPADKGTPSTLFPVMVPALISCSETAQLSHYKKKSVWGLCLVSQVWTEDLVRIEEHMTKMRQQMSFFILIPVV